MKATVQTENGRRETFTLELSFIEMHILINAMSEYGLCGFNPRGAIAEGKFNESHATAAEKLSDEMTEIYCHDVPRETSEPAPEPCALKLDDGGVYDVDPTIYEKARIAYNYGTKWYTARSLDGYAHTFNLQKTFA